MKRCFDVNGHFLFCPVKEIAVSNRHPLLNARIVDQHIQITVFLVYPFKESHPFICNCQVASLGNDRRQFLACVLQCRLTPAANDHGIVLFYEPLSEC